MAFPHPPLGGVSESKIVISVKLSSITPNKLLIGVNCFCWDHHQDRLNSIISITYFQQDPCNSNIGSSFCFGPIQIASYVCSSLWTQNQLVGSYISEFDSWGSVFPKPKFIRSKHFTRVDADNCIWHDEVSRENTQILFILPTRNRLNGQSKISLIF